MSQPTSCLAPTLHACTSTLSSLSPHPAKSYGVRPVDRATSAARLTGTLQRASSRACSAVVARSSWWVMPSDPQENVVGSRNAIHEMSPQPLPIGAVPVSGASAISGRHRTLQQSWHPAVLGSYTATWQQIAPARCQASTASSGRSKGPSLDSQLQTQSATAGVPPHRVPRFAASFTSQRLEIPRTSSTGGVSPEQSPEQRPAADNSLSRGVPRSRHSIETGRPPRPQS